jgi:hypothetical protein
MRDLEFYTRDDGTKCVSFFEDLDVVIITERDVRHFQSRFDKMDASVIAIKETR